VYSIAAVGTVVGGTIRSGTVKEGDGLLLGPSDDGRFFPITVGSIHRNRLPCRVAMAGQAACIAIGKTEPCPLRKVLDFIFIVFVFYVFLNVFSVCI